MKERTKGGGNTASDPDILKRSFERETDKSQRKENKAAAGDRERRSLMGAPVDPNSPTTKGNFPPGLPAGDVIDPGRATPDADTVDNRSGQPHSPRK